MAGAERLLDHKTACAAAGPEDYQVHVDPSHG
jgi:hypothetical protein